MFKRNLLDPTRKWLPPPVKQSVHGAKYLVEEIVGHEDKIGKLNKIQRFYRLYWTGWDSAYDTWEALGAGQMPGAS
jgi:hypothetical protein